MFGILSDILDGKKEAPEIPFRIELVPKNILVVCGIFLVTATLFTLILKALKK